MNYKRKLPENLKKPFCSTEFSFSMYSYDHLKGVADRKLLINSSEAGLVNPVPQAKNLDEFGHRIYEALEKVKQIEIIVMGGPMKSKMLNFDSHVFRFLVLTSVFN